MEKDKNNFNEINLNKYKDSEGLSLGKLNFGLWLSENRARIKKAIIAILIAFSAFFFIYSSYNYVIYFFSHKTDTNLVDNSIIASRDAVKDLIIGNPQILADGERRDLVVKLQNPNDKFMANFNYCFVTGQTEIACGRGFILPSEEKYILALGQTFTGSDGLVFRIKDLFWQRINAHQISDWNAFSSERLNLAVAGISFTPARNSGLSEKINLNSLEFNISNQTPYGYYEVPLNILLFNGVDLVGVGRYTLKDFTSGKKEVVKISWPGELNFVSRTDVQPDLNILDETVYLKYQGAELK